MRALLLHLEGPLQSYGAEAVDTRRPISEIPGRALLTGLMANAMGYRRTDPAAHDALQARVSYAARIDRRGEVVRDFQTARISRSDTGWTTWGVRQERQGGVDSYGSPLIRLADYHADRICVVALTLRDGDGPTLDEVAQALARPMRPLFIGRKTCLPSGPIFAGIREGNSLFDILLSEPLRPGSDSGGILVQVDGKEGGNDWHARSVSDSCSWRTRIYGGARTVSQAHIPHKAFPEAA